MASSLLHAIKTQRGEATTRGGEVRELRSAAAVAKDNDRGLVIVDVKAVLTRELVGTIEKAGGEIIYLSEAAGVVRTRIPLRVLEELAALPSIRSIQPAAQAKTHRQLDRSDRISLAPEPFPFKNILASRASRPGRPDASFDRRAMNIRRQLPAALSRVAVRPLQEELPTVNVGASLSEGDTAHRVREARNFFGVSGAGVRIGVLSDSDDFREQSIASGDLPADVTVLPGQSGRPGSGEGTAMLEIVHDLAPGAKLFFATAFNGIDSFADNIRALRAAGCDIIVDDVIYANESPFHDDTVSAAVQQVVADGALYFSSAGNEGNFNDGTSSAWEGDFRDSGTTLAILPGGTLHDFSFGGFGVISNRVESSTTFILGLWWSDPAGGSGNDYDLFILNNTLTAVVDASTGVQDGDDDPFEATFPGAFAGERIVIFKTNGAETRALHLNNFGGQLGISTPGSTHGHNSVLGAFGVAAIDAALAGGGSFTGGPTNPVELFSSDGFRRVFYKSDGTPFTPGNLLFNNLGGQVRRKPDLTAVDGVSTNVPGFGIFFGTSAAAPHAAAIAGLLKSAKPNLTVGQARQALLQTATDIEAVGFDRDSGAGIIDAFSALLSIGAPPAPFLELGPVAAAPIGGNGDPIIDPGESARLTVRLVNSGGATAITPRATLTTSTPGVTITAGTANYPNIGSNGQSATNTTPFTFTLDSTAPCGSTIDFTLTVTYINSNVGPQVFNLKVPTVPPTFGAQSYAGAPVVIPSNAATTIDIPLVVSGLTTPVNGLKFRFDGTSCTADAGATSVGLDHTWVGDLLVTLISPQGTSVNLMFQPGGPFNNGNNFCNTVLDDSATALIQGITPIGNPWTGSFKPANPLATFNGENGNGTWILRVTDVFPADGGNVRGFSLVFSTFTCSTP